MKTIKNSLRIWITAGSLAGFIGGWALLAHSPKPAQSASDLSQAGGSSQAQVELQPLPTLAPLPPMGAPVVSNSQNFQLSPSVPQTTSNFGSFRPRFRTGGS